MKNGVKYFNTYLMKGSKAYELWEEMQKDSKAKSKLDAHLKELDKKYKELMGN